MILSIRRRDRMSSASDGGSGARNLHWNSHVTLENEVFDEWSQINTGRYIQV